MIISELPDIEILIPHRHPMRLVDRVVEVDADSVVALATVPYDGPFVRADADPPGYLVIEMMAQSVSAWHGWTCRQAGETPRIGYLLGTRELRCVRPTLEPGSRLRIAASAMFRDAGVGSFSCTVWDEPTSPGACPTGEAPFATANITVFVPASTDAEASS